MTYKSYEGSESRNENESDDDRSEMRRENKSEMEAMSERGKWDNENRQER